MPRVILAGLKNAFAALSLLPTTRTDGGNESVKAWTLICFPLVGLFFGALGVLFIEFGYQRLPYFVSWAIPLFWLIFSKAQHFISLGKLSNSLLSTASREEKGKLLVGNELAFPGGALALIVFSGKIFALLQADLLDSRSLMLMVLLTPAVARYTALMLALGSDAPHQFPMFVEKRGTVVLVTSLLVLAFLALGGALLLLLLITSLLVTVLVRSVTLRSCGVPPIAALGASVEISEVALLWVTVITASYGVNLLLFSLSV